ncbi:MAG: hypothetical protein V4710_22485 [Verrucomicrobiota bacterium]
MLIQYPIRRIENDFDRCWITDDYFDLYIWYEPDGGIHGFQLCYDKPCGERALTWTKSRGYRHSKVESGEETPTSNRAPLLVQEKAFDVEGVRNEFLLRSSGVDLSIRELVLARMEEYAARIRGAS